MERHGAFGDWTIGTMPIAFPSKCKVCITSWLSWSGAHS